jgi:hypothetical protein
MQNINSWVELQDQKDKLIWVPNNSETSDKDKIFQLVQNGQSISKQNLKKAILFLKSKDKNIIEEQFGDFDAFLEAIENGYIKLENFDNNNNLNYEDYWFKWENDQLVRGNEKIDINAYNSSSQKYVIANLNINLLIPEIEEKLGKTLEEYLGYDEKNIENNFSKLIKIIDDIDDPTYTKSTKEILKQMYESKKKRFKKKLQEEKKKVEKKIIEDLNEIENEKSYEAFEQKKEKFTKFVKESKYIDQKRKNQIKNDLQKQEQKENELRQIYVDLIKNVENKINEFNKKTFNSQLDLKKDYESITSITEKQLENYETLKDEYLKQLTAIYKYKNLLFGKENVLPYNTTKEQSNLKETDSDLNLKYTTLKEKLDKTKTKLKKERKEYLKIIEELENGANDTDKIKKVKNKYEIEKQKFEEHQKNLNENYEKLEKQFKDLEKQFKDLQKNNDLQKKEFQQKEKESKQKFEDLQKNNNDIQKKEFQQKKQEFQQKEKDLEELNKKYKQDLQTEKSKTERNTKDIEDLKKYYVDQAKIYNKIEKENEKNKQKITELEEDLIEQEKENTKLIETTKNTIKNKEREFEQQKIVFDEKISSQENQIVELTKKNYEYEHKVENLDLNVKKLTNKFNKLKETKNTLNTNKNNDKLENIKKEKEKLEKIIKEKDNVIGDLQKQLSKPVVYRKEEAAAKIEKDVDILQNVLKKFYNTSYNDFGELQKDYENISDVLQKKFNYLKENLEKPKDPTLPKTTYFSDMSYLPSNNPTRASGPYNYFYG